MIEHVLFENIKILIFKNQQPCPFESFKKILYGFIRNVFFATFEPLYHAFTCDILNKYNFLPSHLFKEITILDIIIRTFQFEKYVIHGAFNTSIMFKGCNEVLNLRRTKGMELVDHLVKFLPSKNFHMPFPILIETFDVSRRL